MKLGMVITVVKIVLLKLHLKIERNNMDKMKEMFELRNAIRIFLEEKLEAKVQGAGMSITEPSSADISFKIDNTNYVLTIDEV
jgi:hypothetical protein